MKTKPYSITLYAALFIGVFLLVMGVLGLLTHIEILRMEEKFHIASQFKAADEVNDAVATAIADIEDHTRDYAAWEEVGQQLQNPIFYTYWYRHRAMNRNLLPDYVIDMAVYDFKGDVLAKIDSSKLPHKIDPQDLSTRIESIDSSPVVITLAPVVDPTDHTIRGYTALLSGFLYDFFRLGRFSQIDQKSILFNLKENQSIAWTELPDKIQFRFLSNPLVDDLKEVMSQSVIRLAVILSIFTLLIVPLATWLIGRPIRRISQQIDQLKETTGHAIPNSFEKRLPIKELDKVRELLNAYHTELNQVHSNLDEKNKELWKLAHHDPLTGVRNRRAFDEYCREINNVFADSRNLICLALIDVNHFKAINDSYGHQVGDQVLVAISQSINQVLRKGEYLFRLGGDEFAVVLIDCPPKEAHQIAERCQQAIGNYPFKQLGINEPVRISIGLSHSSANKPGSLLSLQWQADVAMYTAKRPGNSHIAHFNPEMAKAAKGLFSNRTHNAIYEAVTHGTGLVMHYQPIVKLGDASVQFYEAVVRIDHDNEVIMPSHIFPLVEARRLELDLDRMVINKIYADLRNLAIPEGTGVSINISAPALVDSAIIQQLATFQPIMQNYQLVIEITETALITQLQTATNNLEKLQLMGFNIALDDFGSGYSSLRYLAQMPVDIVKFDISLTHLVNDLSQEPILNHLTKMIDEAGYQLVAEGIETEELATKLLDLGFELGQGYHFGSPGTPSKLSA